MLSLICPIGTCQTSNDLHAETCIRCGIPLQGYKRMKIYSSQLFNDGLVKSRSGHYREARDVFAAIVCWYPMDIEARNALAMVCLAQKDFEQASQQWNIVLQQSPSNAIARQGMEKLQRDAKGTDKLTNTHSSIEVPVGENHMQKLGSQQKGNKRYVLKILLWQFLIRRS